LRFEAILANNSQDPISKTNGLGVWLKWQRACFVSAKARVQTPVPSKKKGERCNLFLFN
jgi:hypothetical protein